jgi:phosphoglycolate phosphatase-like HAD superfamily hydrolase
MRTILFDWDGTIVDSIGALYETDAAICRRIGVPFDLAIFRRTFSPNWRHMYDSLGIPKDRTEEAVQVWRETFRSDRTRPFDGVQGALARLVMGGYTLGVVTGGDRAGVEPQLRRLGIDDLMRVRVYSDDTSAGKPHPAPLLYALDLAGGCTPADAVYVGDALDDMRMASAAGVRGIGIVSMLARAEELTAAGAVETAASVVEWVDRILGTSGIRRATASPDAAGGQP